jgi:hypothetical protein
MFRKYRMVKDGCSRNGVQVYTEGFIVCILLVWVTGNNQHSYASVAMELEEEYYII